MHRDGSGILTPRGVLVLRCDDDLPTPFPTGFPTTRPTLNPTQAPSWAPTPWPSRAPSQNPTYQPSQTPTLGPTAHCHTDTDRLGPAHAASPEPKAGGQTWSLTTVEGAVHIEVTLEITCYDTMFPTE